MVITLQQPWKLIKEDQEAAGAVLSNCLHLIRIFAITAAPIMPVTSQKLWDLLLLEGKPQETAISEAAQLQAMPPQKPVSQKVVLFEKIDSEKESALKAEYSN